MKTKTFNVGLIFAIFIAIFPISSHAENRLIIPDKIGIYFSPSSKNNNLPAIILNVFAGNGCDEVGVLQITKNLKPHQANIYTKGGIVDILEIQIIGYEFKKAPSLVDITCPSVIKESRTVIEIDNIMNKQQLQINILLHNYENIFEMSRFEDVFYLNPVKTSHVISWNPSENMPEHAQRIGFMTPLFQKQIAKVRLNGSYALKSDLGTRLREYVNKLGYVPLDEKLNGYPRMNPLNEFIVFVPKGKEIPEEFTIIGKVNYHEIPGGDKAINVGLLNANINPFFVRY